MTLIQLTPRDLALAFVLVLALALAAKRMNLGLAGAVLTAAIRTVIQLSLIGLVLKALFESVNPWLMVLVALVMLAVSGREVMARQKNRLAGIWGFSVGAISMFISSFSVTALALVAVIGPSPWYMPQYAIPLLGMLLGNTMNGVALSLDRLTQTATDQREVIEARLILGQTWQQASAEMRDNSVRAGLTPIINSMSVIGLVSLPGMMTGQILSGSPPTEAVKYQILIMFLIAGGTGFGTLAAVRMATRRLFDDRHRLRLDRLKDGK